VQELIPGSAVAVTVEQDSIEHRSRSDRAIQRALGKEVTVRRRSDGKPWVADGLNVSTAHTGDLTLAVVGHGHLACDAEIVVVRPDRVWRDLLGLDRLLLAGAVAEEAGEERVVAETRVWAATECLKKAGATTHAPLVLTSSTADGWVLLSSGARVVATVVGSVRGVQDRVILAVLASGDGGRRREAVHAEQAKGRT
jgi:enediyne polyketide synthase